MEESMHVGEQETSLQDQSYHTIRRKIVYLDYKPGEKLASSTLRRARYGGAPLCARLLVRLAQECLVRTVPQSGTYVSPSTSPLPRVPVTSASIWKSRCCECCARATSAGIEQLDRAIVLQEKAMAEEIASASF